MNLLIITLFSQLENQQIIKYQLIIIVLLFIALLVAAILLWRFYNENKSIKEKKKDLKDSITSAQLIQKAILPPFDKLKDYLQTFILYKPLNTVSGDFYWMMEKEDKLIVAAADCTGHGVQGAFMSMAGVAFLNEIVGKENEIDAAEILNKLRDRVIDFLNQVIPIDKDKEHEESMIQHEKEDKPIQNGMDISLCVIDYQKMTLQYAGANNSIYLIRDSNTELEEVKADKMPIGYDERRGNKKFANKLFALSHGDCIYMFSDGFEDQFDCHNKKKFSSKKVRESLLKVSKLPIDVQEILMEQLFNKWKGNNEQTDDVMLLGIRILK